MAQADKAKILTEAQQLLNAGSPDLKELLRTAKRLYVAGEPYESRRLEQRALKLAREKADDFLRRERVDADEGRALAEQLKGLNEHAHARRILSRVRAQDPKDLRVARQLALSTYKDEELPPDSALSEALKILDETGLRDPKCTDPETLRLGGAVCKRRWERTGQIEDLYTSLHFYRRGWTENKRDDMGYCGINAAYILDSLAYRARIAAAREKIAARHADELAAEARGLREEMKRLLPGIAEEKAREAQERGDDDPRKRWWYLVTMAEVAFGLEEWEEASGWLARAREVEHDEWERQTTAKQLVAIARIRGFSPPEKDSKSEQWEAPWRALQALLGEDAPAAFDSHRGKVGLALSGGGFRASLYHLGVLARLAECDALRCVEVLSTVSGGSILGAHYYLALRHRLQTRTDGQLGRDEYLALVREVMEHFCAGVRKNLRMRALSSLWANLKMLFSRSYGRSNRMGELYERHLYDKVADGHAPKTLRKMLDLLIRPVLRPAAAHAAPQRDEGFKPRFSNWRRKAKVPILLLNTTSLNSGHNWHFTASWMGEPPGLTGQEVDINGRYRRLYYGQAPARELRDYPLGYAVAASAGVPMLFDPLVLAGLYPDRTVRLVDGGVHDNQGVAGLLDEGCNLILCSDASGQMDDQNSPASGAVRVFFRSDSIVQDRVRETQYQDLAWRAQGHMLQGLFFVHLKQELDTDPIDWIGCQDPGLPIRRARCTSYGVDRRIQKLLSEVRTDLDTFSEVEACALMASGYLVTDHQLRELGKEHQRSGLNGEWSDFDVNAPRAGDWPFSALLPVMSADPEGGDRRARDLARQLKASRMLFGKVWVLVPWLGAAAIALGLAGVAAGGWWVYENWRTVYPLRVDLGVVDIVAALGVLAACALLPLGKFIKPVDTFRKWLFLVVLATVGWAATNLYLLLLDPLYRGRGKLERLMKLPAE